MKRLLLLLLLTLPYAWNVAADTNNSRPAGTKAQKAANVDPTKDPGTRKLSKRERKERVAALAQKYRDFLAHAEPIMAPTELNAFLLLESDAQRDLYIDEFWRRRDPDPRTALNEYRQQYEELLVDAKEKYRSLSSDRSRMYIVRGAPDQIVEVDCPRLFQPIEVWSYQGKTRADSPVTFVFYEPRTGIDYRLWMPIGRQRDALEELLSPEGQKLVCADVDPSDRRGMLQRTDCLDLDRDLFGGRTGNTFLGFHCPDSAFNALGRGVRWSLEKRMEIAHAFDPPPVEEEDVGRILRSSVIATPNAPKIDATIAAAYPGKRGSRTSTELTIRIPRAQLVQSPVQGATVFNVDVTGETLKGEKLFENYRYRFDIPADAPSEFVAVVVERFLQPADYRARIKLTDVNGSGEAILETDLHVPYVEDPPQTAEHKEAVERVDLLHQEVRSGESTLRLVPLPDELLTGLQKVETIVTGDRIKAVEFYLDGRKVMTKRSLPYTLELDLGTVPQPRKVKAVALAADGSIVTGDELVINSGSDPFRLRIVAPRLAQNVSGNVRVVLDASVPEDQQLDRVEIFLNETRLATLYSPPFVQTIRVPENLGIGYIRAIAMLKDQAVTPAEDVVWLNAPEFLQEVDVHLVELPTTVVSSGKTVADLTQSAFQVFDENKPVKLAKFEYVKNLPLSVGLAIDTSGSMRVRIDEARKAAAQFFQNVLHPGDKAFLVGFDRQAVLLQKWSPKLSDLSGALASIRAEETTALYDAIVYSLYNFLGVKGQRALIVISDGEDTSSTFSYDQAMEYARRAGVPIYTVGIGIGPSKADVKHRLSKFATETGGNVYFIERAGELQRIYGDIEQELRSQYLLGFYPPEGVKPGSKWREVRVEVKGAKVKTIRGYFP